MNATETRNQLAAMAASLADHLAGLVAEMQAAGNAKGEWNWSMVGDLECVVNQLCEQVSFASGRKLTPIDALETAREVAENAATAAAECAEVVAIRRV